MLDEAQAGTITGPRKLEVLALSGSLRKGSYNRRLLEAARELAPDGMSITVHDGLDEVPPFNEDLERPPDGPPGVARLRRAVARSDGVLIATPEYFQSVPGVVKNVLDWLGRSSPGEDLTGVPVAVTGATTGAWGTRLAQTLLRQMLLSHEALLLPSPMLYVRNVDSLFDGGGVLTDAETTRRLTELLVSFREWIRLVSSRRRAAAAC